VDQVADRAVADELQHLPRLGMEAVHVRLDQHPVGDAGGVGHGHRLTVVGRDRLFAQHMLAGPQRGDGQLGVGGVHGGDVDGVDALVGQDRGVVTGVLGAELVGEGPGPLGVGAADRDQRAVLAGGELAGEAAGDVSRAEDGPAKGIDHECAAPNSEVLVPTGLAVNVHSEIHASAPHWLGSTTL
jgi:hypothetical protein